MVRKSGTPIVLVAGLLSCSSGNSDDPTHRGLSWVYPSAENTDLEMTCGATACPTGMVLVPCSRFVMGSDGEEGPNEERPEHIVRVSDFCIDATEVTQEAWAACVARGPCPAMPDDCDAPRGPDDPVVCISPEAAYEYCDSVGKRLPTEPEWEKAARGGCEIVAPETCGPEDERTYPWGDAPPTCDHANFWPREQPEPCLGVPDVVGARPRGASPYGALDLAGNVREWVFVPGDRFPFDRSIARGGHFRSSARVVRAASREIVDPDRTVGFRCAVTP